MNMYPTEYPHADKRLCDLGPIATGLCDDHAISGGH